MSFNQTTSGALPISGTNIASESIVVEERAILYVQDDNEEYVKFSTKPFTITLYREKPK